MSAPRETLVQLHVTLLATRRRGQATWAARLDLPAGLTGSGRGRSLRAASMRALDDALRLWNAARAVTP